MYVSEQKLENNINPCNSQFYYIKMGVRGFKLHERVSMMDVRQNVQNRSLNTA